VGIWACDCCRLASIEKPFRWNELITLSAKYRDLTANAQLALTVWDVSSPRQEVAVGSATLGLFSSKKQLKTGKQKLRLWRGRKADGSVPTSTPGKVFVMYRVRSPHLLCIYKKNADKVFLRSFANILQSIAVIIPLPSRNSG
jgi:hypothetical protein